MAQCVVLHTQAVTDHAERFVSILQAAGFDAPWVPSGGAMINAGALVPEEAPCTIVLWTEDAVVSRWVLLYAEIAHRRGTLVEVLLDRVKSPIHSSTPPLDFTDFWDGRPQGQMTRMLLQRVEAMCGEPNVKLPLYKQIGAMFPVLTVGAAAVAIMATGGPDLQPSGADFTSQPVAQEETQAPAEAMGGPAAQTEENFVANFEDMDAPIDEPITVHFHKAKLLPNPMARVASSNEQVAVDGPDSVVIRVVNMKRFRRG